jgi:YD repeat-containing protein
VLADGAIPGPVNLLDYNGNPYDPTQFLLTTADGYTYTIDQTLGVTQVKDLNGNTLTINASGVVSSAGKSVAFTRDGQGRITQIADPSGAYLTYNYSGAGDLASVTDRAQNTTTFDYDGNHYLLTINDPRGTAAVRNTYDNSGRLLTTTDANGKTIHYTQNIAGQIEQVIGNRSHCTNICMPGAIRSTELTPLDMTSILVASQLLPGWVERSTPSPPSEPTKPLRVLPRASP